jgi:hypothetical protein
MNEHILNNDKVDMTIVNLMRCITRSTQMDFFKEGDIKSSKKEMSLVIEDLDGGDKYEIIIRKVK